MDLPDAPTVNNILTNVAVFIGTGVAAAIYYIRSKAATVRSPPESPQSMVLNAASIADMGPVRDITVQLRRIADYLDSINTRMEKTSDDALIEREVQRRIRMEQDRRG